RVVPRDGGARARGSPATGRTAPAAQAGSQGRLAVGAGSAEARLQRRWRGRGHLGDTARLRLAPIGGEPLHVSAVGPAWNELNQRDVIGGPAKRHRVITPSAARAVVAARAFFEAGHRQYIHGKFKELDQARSFHCKVSNKP